uniref:Putative secreted peptide n=1 Tax=Anopheles braziliensis TaxID=58242 RepID=A0A2M3ZWY0_9DIPT
MFNIIVFIFYFLISTTPLSQALCRGKGVRKGFRDFSPFCINISLFLFISRREYLSKLDWLVVSFVFVLPLATIYIEILPFFCTLSE